MSENNDIYDEARSLNKSNDKHQPNIYQKTHAPHLPEQYPAMVGNQITPKSRVPPNLTLHGATKESKKSLDQMRKDNTGNFLFARGFNRGLPSIFSSDVKTISKTFKNFRDHKTGDGNDYEVAMSYSKYWEIEEICKIKKDIHIFKSPTVENLRRIDYLRYHLKFRHQNHIELMNWSKLRRTLPPKSIKKFFEKNYFVNLDRSDTKVNILLDQQGLLLKCFVEFYQKKDFFFRPKIDSMHVEVNDPCTRQKIRERNREQSNIREYYFTYDDNRQVKNLDFKALKTFQDSHKKPDFHEHDDGFNLVDFCLYLLENYFPDKNGIWADEDHINHIVILELVRVSFEYGLFNVSNAKNVVLKLTKAIKVLKRLEDQWKEKLKEFYDEESDSDNYYLVRNKVIGGFHEIREHMSAICIQIITQICDESFTACDPYQYFLDFFHRNNLSNDDMELPYHSGKTMKPHSGEDIKKLNINDIAFEKKFKRGKTMKPPNANKASSEDPIDVSSKGEFEIVKREKLIKKLPWYDQDFVRELVQLCMDFLTIPVELEFECDPSNQTVANTPTYKTSEKMVEKLFLYITTNKHDLFIKTISNISFLTSGFYKYPFLTYENKHHNKAKDFYNILNKLIYEIGSGTFDVFGECENLDQMVTDVLDDLMIENEEDGCINISTLWSIALENLKLANDNQDDDQDDLNKNDDIGSAEIPLKQSFLQPSKMIIFNTFEDFGPSEVFTQRMAEEGCVVQQIALARYCAEYFNEEFLNDTAIEDQIQWLIYGCVENCNLARSQLFKDQGLLHVIQMIQNLDNMKIYLLLNQLTNKSNISKYISEDFQDCVFEYFSGLTIFLRELWDRDANAEDSNPLIIKKKIQSQFLLGNFIDNISNLKLTNKGDELSFRLRIQNTMYEVMAKAVLPFYTRLLQFEGWKEVDKSDMIERELFEKGRDTDLIRVIIDDHIEHEYDNHYILMHCCHLLLKIFNNVTVSAYSNNAYKIIKEHIGEIQNYFFHEIDVNKELLPVNKDEEIMKLFQHFVIFPESNILLECNQNQLELTSQDSINLVMALQHKLPNYVPEIKNIQSSERKKSDDLIMNSTIFNTPDDELQEEGRKYLYDGLLTIIYKYAVCTKNLSILKDALVFRTQNERQETIIRLIQKYKRAIMILLNIDEDPFTQLEMSYIMDYEAKKMRNDNSAKNLLDIHPDLDRDSSRKHFAPYQSEDPSSSNRASDRQISEQKKQSVQGDNNKKVSEKPQVRSLANQIKDRREGNIKRNVSFEPTGVDQKNDLSSLDQFNCGINANGMNHTMDTNLVSLKTERASLIQQCIKITSFIDLISKGKEVKKERKHYDNVSSMENLDLLKASIKQSKRDGKSMNELLNLGITEAELIRRESILKGMEVFYKKSKKNWRLNDLDKITDDTDSNIVGVFMMGVQRILKDDIVGKDKVLQKHSMLNSGKRSFEFTGFKNSPTNDSIKFGFNEDNVESDAKISEENMKKARRMMMSQTLLKYTVDNSISLFWTDPLCVSYIKTIDKLLTDSLSAREELYEYLELKDNDLQNNEVRKVLRILSRIQYDCQKFLAWSPGQSRLWWHIHSVFKRIANIFQNLCENNYQPFKKIMSDRKNLIGLNDIKWEYYDKSFNYIYQNQALFIQSLTSLTTNEDPNIVKSDNAKKILPLLNPVLETLNEFITGPCFLNQKEVIDCPVFLMHVYGLISRHIDDLKSPIYTLKVTFVTILLSLTEGNTKYVMKILAFRYVPKFFIDAILDMIKKLYIREFMKFTTKTRNYLIKRQTHNSSSFRNNAIQANMPGLDTNSQRQRRQSVSTKNKDSVKNMGRSSKTNEVQPTIKRKDNKKVLLDKSKMVDFDEDEEEVPVIHSYDQLWNMYRISKDFSENEGIDIAFNLFQLWKNLAQIDKEHKARFKDITNERYEDPETIFIFNFLNMINHKIEIRINQEKSIIVNFRKYPQCIFLTDISKTLFMNKVDFQDSSKKMRDLFTYYDLFHIEMMDGLNLFRRNRQLHLLSKTDNIQIYRIIIWWIGMVMNIIELFAIELNYDTNIYAKFDVLAVFIDERFTYSPQITFSIIMIFRFVILSLSFIVIMLWFDTKFKSSFRLHKSQFCIDYYVNKKNNSWIYNWIVYGIWSTNNKIQIDQLTWRQKYINIMFGKTILLNSDIANFNLHLIFSVAGMFSPVFDPWHLLLIINIESTSKLVYMAAVHKFPQIIMTFVFGIIQIYCFSILVMYDYSRYWNYEELGDNIEPCKKLWTCFLYTLNEGLRQGGGIGDMLNQVDMNNHSFMIAQIIFEIGFFICIQIFILNIILGIIIDAFTEIRTEEESRNYDMENICFVCGNHRSNFVKEGLDFQNHTECEHHIWNYVFYIFYQDQKGEKNLSGLEYKFWKEYEEKKTGHIPIGDTTYLSKFFVFIKIIKNMMIWMIIMLGLRMES